MTAVTPEHQEGAFIPLQELDGFWDGEMESFDVDGQEVLLVKVDGAVHAFDGKCPHQSRSLIEGSLDGREITCPAHAWQFDATTGAGINPTTTRLHQHDVRIVDGTIEVLLRPRPCAVRPTPSPSLTVSHGNGSPT